MCILILHILRVFLPPRSIPHHSDTASDGEHAPFSFLDTSPVFLIVISLLGCYIKIVISLFDSARRTSFLCIFLYISIFCTLFIGLHFVMS